MVILRLTKPVCPEFECEDITPGNESLNLVRPCERYKEIYKSCKSIRGRLHQYYVYGELFDCSIHNDHYEACKKYRKTKNIDILEPIIEWEKNLMRTRLETVKQNTVWEPREKPPDEFSKPLAEFLKNR